MKEFVVVYYRNDIESCYAHIDMKNEQEGNEKAINIAQKFDIEHDNFKIYRLKRRDE